MSIVETDGKPITLEMDGHVMRMDVHSDNGKRSLYWRDARELAIRIISMTAPFAREQAGKNR